MGENIEWASPHKTEVWSYDGRLYQSKKKAEIQRNSIINSRAATQKRYPDRRFSWPEIGKIYKINWVWEEDND